MSSFIPFRPERGTESLKEVLSRLFLARGWGRTSGQAKLEEAWSAAVGPEWKDHSRAVVLKRGVLEVWVTDALVLQHLVMIKAMLIASVSEKLGQSVKEIRFRVGK